MIQTFPPDFKWVGTKTAIEQMIGNAVPVNLAQYVAKVVEGVAGRKKPRKRAGN